MKLFLGTNSTRSSVPIYESAEHPDAALGDILLYASRYICIFWGANTYSYTRIGRIEGMSADELKEMFEGDVKIGIQQITDTF